MHKVWFLWVKVHTTMVESEMLMKCLETVNFSIFHKDDDLSPTLTY